ncbi:MAG: hypothetical protein ACR2LN_00460 [Candidatus Levyibacteriota bacterium]
MKNITLQLKLRLIFITLAVSNLLLVGIQLLRYPPLLKVPGSLPYIIEPIMLLILYIGIILWITEKTDTPRATVLQIGTFIGLICSVLELINLIREHFLHGGGRIDGSITLLFMLGLFLLWGVASFQVTRLTSSMSQGILASIWTVVVTFLIGILFGFIQEFYLYVPDSAQVATWQEFIRSGWKDIPAFTIANTLDSASSHLFIGLLVALVFGAIGGGIGKLFARRK